MFYNNAQNADRFSADLPSVPWHIAEMFSGIDDKWYFWKSLFNSVIIERFPISRKRVRKSTYPWLDKSIGLDLGNSIGPLTGQNTGDCVILFPHLSEKPERITLLKKYKILNQTREASGRQLA